MIPKTMRRARVRDRGQELLVEEAPVPSPGPGEILIRVESAGVNFSDLKRRRGDLYPFETQFPFVPGAEIAGEVVALGQGVAGPPIGSKVFALAGAGGEGGYAQFATSYAPTVVPLPPGLSADVGSVLLVAGATAKLMLKETARLAEGETVLIPSATGGVGSFAVQLARLAGAQKVIAAVGAASKREQARALGAHEVLDTSKQDWPEEARRLTDGKGVDVAVESTGGDSLGATLRCLAPFGRLVVIGASTGESARLAPETSDRWLYAPAPCQSIAAFNLGAWFQLRPSAAGAALASLVEDVLRERIRPPAIRPLPLSEAQRAHDLLASRSVAGKLVLKPWS